MRGIHIGMVVLAAVSLLLVPAREPEASSSGISGFTGDPATGGLDCNACHSQGQAPTVTLAGPLTVTPGSTQTYTLRITGGQSIAGGLGVSASAGTLAVVDPGTWLLNGEIVHTSPRAVDGVGAVQWSFNWTAPLTPGLVTLYGAGNSVNLSNGANRDLATRATLGIDVSSGGGMTPGESSGPGALPLQVTAYDKITGDMGLGWDPACEATEHNVYYGDLADVATLSWAGEVCGIGITGLYSGFNPGSGSYFFVVVGTKGGDEGSYGKSRLPDGSQVERAPYAGNLCGQVQTLADPCP